MAASVSVSHNLGKVGTLVGRVVSVTMDSSYASNGEAITAEACGLSRIVAAGFLPNGGWVPEWDQANLKIIARGQDGDTTGDPVALSEAASTTNLATIVFTGFVYGYS